MNKDPNRWKKWEETRAKGKSHFVWRFGVLWWGGMMALIFGVKHFLQPMEPQWIGYALLLIFPVGGYFCGLWIWRMMERAYQREHNQS